MDILEENLSTLLPSREAQPPGESAAAESQSDSSAAEEDGINLVSVGEHMLEALDVLLRDPEAWDIDTPAKVIEATVIMCRILVLSTVEIEKPKADEVEVLAAPLAMLEQILPRVWSMPWLFPSTQAREEFRWAVLRQVKRAKKVLHRSNEIIAMLDSVRQKASHAARPNFGNVKKDRTMWPAWSSNTVGVGSQEMREAIIRKSDFKTVAAYLPRGGCAIVEQWRADVDEVVESILQVNRSKAAEAQGTTKQSTYLSSITEGKKSFNSTTTLVDQPGGNMYRSAMDVMMSQPGQILGALDELEPRRPGQQPRAVWQTTHMDIKRMREARDERASNVGGFGSAW